MKNIRNILSFLLVIPVAAQAIEQSSDVESLDALRAFIEVYEHIKGEYVEEIDDQTLLNDAINGIGYFACLHGLHFAIIRRADHKPLPIAKTILPVLPKPSEHTTVNGPSHFSFERLKRCATRLKL